MYILDVDSNLIIFNLVSSLNLELNLNHFLCLVTFSF